MRAIVKLAGINERMIYHHFRSKVGLYEAVLADVWLTSAGARLVYPPDDSDPREAFIAALNELLRGLLLRRHFLALILHEALNGWAHVPEASLGDVPKPLRKLFRKGQREGVFAKDCRFEVVYLTAIGAVVANHLLAARFTDLRSDSKRDRLLADVLALVLKGVAP